MACGKSVPRCVDRVRLYFSLRPVGAVAGYMSVAVE